MTDELVRPHGDRCVEAEALIADLRARLSQCEAERDEARTEALIGPVAVTRKSPNGTSLTYCCCDRTTARLLVCPVHGDTRKPPALPTTGDES